MGIESGRDYFEGLRNQDKSLKEIKSELQQKTSNELNELKLDIYLSQLLKSEGLKIVKHDTLEYINIIFKKFGSSNHIKWNKEADIIEVGDIIKIKGNNLYKIRDNKKIEIGKINIPTTKEKTKKDKQTKKGREKLNIDYSKIDSNFSLIEKEIDSTKNFINIAKKDIKSGNQFDWFEKAFKYVATGGDYNKTTKQENYENSINHSIITIYKILGKLKIEIEKLKNNGGNRDKIKEYKNKYNILIKKVKELNNGKEIPGITFLEADENSSNETIENIKSGKSGEVLFGYGKGLLKGTWEIVEGIGHMVKHPIQTVNGIGKALGTGMFLVYGEFLGSKEEQIIAREITSKIAEKIAEVGDLPPEQMGELVGKIVANIIIGDKAMSLVGKGLSITTKVGLKALKKNVGKAYMVGYKESTALERVGKYGEEVSETSLVKTKPKIKELPNGEVIDIEFKVLKEEIILPNGNKTINSLKRIFKNNKFNIIEIKKIIESISGINEKYNFLKKLKKLGDIRKISGEILVKMKSFIESSEFLKLPIKIQKEFKNMFIKIQEEIKNLINKIKESRKKPKVKKEEPIKKESEIKEKSGEKIIKPKEKPLKDEVEPGKKEYEGDMNEEEIKKTKDHFNENTNIKKIGKEEIHKIKENLGKEYKSFYEKSDIFKPSYEIIADGKKFSTTDIIISSDGRKCIIGYTEFNGKYEPRLFYFSESGGNWHCTPGVELELIDGIYNTRFSKGEFLGLSYEKGTIISEEISKNFKVFKENHIGKDDLGYIWADEFGDFLKYENGFKQKYGAEINNGFLSNVKKSFAELSKNFEDYTISDIKNYFKNIEIDSGFDISIKGGFKKGPSHNHNYLGECDTVIGETTLNGESIEVIYAYAKNEPDLIWIEDIRYKNTEINSFGFSKDKINCGTLTTKPLEYKNYMPKSILKKGKSYGKDYIDIREFIQENPLIRHFKSAYGLKNAA